jgi:tetratricopeptide (TPR) repeat protein
MNSQTISAVQQAHRLFTEARFAEGLAALEESPGYATAHIIRAELLLAMGRADEALAAAKQAVLESPNSPSALLLCESAFLHNHAQPPTLSDLFDEDDESAKEPANSLSAGSSSMAAGNEVAAYVMTHGESAEEHLDPNADFASIDDTTGVTDTPGLVSETLARLMIEQGKHAEARKVYIQLSRLHPDRYAYFRGRIDELANLQSSAQTERGLSQSQGSKLA